MLIASDGLIKLNITRTQCINNEIAQNYKIGRTERKRRESTRVTDTKEIKLTNVLIVKFVEFIPNR